MQIPISQPTKTRKKHRRTQVRVIWGRLADLYPLQWPPILYQGPAVGGSVSKALPPSPRDHCQGCFRDETQGPPGDDITTVVGRPSENAVLLLFDASHYFWDSRIDACFEGFNLLGRYVHSGCPEVFRSHPARISRRQDCKWRTRTEGNEWVARGFAQKQFIISLLFVLLLMVSFVLFFVAVDGPKEPSNV